MCRSEVFAKCLWWPTLCWLFPTLTKCHLDAETSYDADHQLSSKTKFCWDGSSSLFKISFKSQAIIPIIICKTSTDIFKHMSQHMSKIIPKLYKTSGGICRILQAIQKWTFEFVQYKNSAVAFPSIRVQMNRSDDRLSLDKGAVFFISSAKLEINLQLHGATNAFKSVSRSIRLWIMHFLVCHHRRR